MIPYLVMFIFVVNQSKSHLGGSCEYDFITQQYFILHILSDYIQKVKLPATNSIAAKNYDGSSNHRLNFISRHNDYSLCTGTKCLERCCVIYIFTYIARRGQFVLILTSSQSSYPNRMIFKITYYSSRLLCRQPSQIAYHYG